MHKKTIGMDSTYRLRAREKPTNDKRAHTYGMGISLTSRWFEISHVSKSRQKANASNI